MKISVIIPAYNCEKYICQTMDIIRTQTFPSRDLEIIFCLDGCSDNTGKKIAEYHKNNPDMNITVLKNATNMGPSAARNKSLKHASGQYIHFMDVDDILNRDFYQNLYNAARDTNADIAVANYISDTNSGHNITYDKKTVLTYPHDKLNATLADRYGNVCRYLIRREFWNKNKMSFQADFKSNDNMLLMCKIIYYCNCLVLTPDAEYTHKTRQNSLSNTEKTQDLQTLCYKRACIETACFLENVGLRPSSLNMTKFFARIKDIVVFANINARVDNTTKIRLFGIVPLVKTIARAFKK